MLLTTKQKFVLEVLKKLGCIRRTQAYALVQGRFEQENFKFSQSAIDAMLRQLRMGVADLAVPR